MSTMPWWSALALFLIHRCLRYEARSLFRMLLQRMLASYYDRSGCCDHLLLARHTISRILRSVASTGGACSCLCKSLLAALVARCLERA